MIMNNPLLAADNLAKGYGTGSARVEVLAECTFELHPEERVVILGQSGVGKSTLLHLLAGLDRADRGEIRFADRQLHAMPESERAHNFGISTSVWYFSSITCCPNSRRWRTS